MSEKFKPPIAICDQPKYQRIPTAIKLLASEQFRPDWFADFGIIVTGAALCLLALAAEA